MRQRLLFAASFSLLLGGAGGTFAGGRPVSDAFLAPTTLGTSFTEDTPSVAIDATGDAIIVWRDKTDTIVARRRSARGVVGPTLKLSGTGGSARFPRAAIDAAGDAFVVWELGVEASAKVQGRSVAANGALGAIQALSAAGEESHEPEVAVTDHGDGFVVWASVNASQTQYTIKARARSASGALGAIKPVSPVGPDTFAPSVGIDGSGNAVIAWQRSDGTNERIEARGLSAAGALSPVQGLSAAGQDANYPSVAVAQSGAAVIAWQRSDGTNVRVQARTRGSSGALGSALNLSGPGANAYYFAMAGNRAGQAVITWSLIDASTAKVQARGLDVTGQLDAAQTISPAGQIASGSNVGVDAFGNAEIAFGGQIGSDHRLLVRRRSASAALDRVETLSAPGGNAYNPGVAVSPGGDALVAWPLVRQPGQDDLLQLSAGP